MNIWYKIKAEAAVPDIFIHDEIGGWGVQASQFIADVQQIKGPINVRINSGGGDIFQGLAIYHYLTERGNVTTQVDGLAASAASVVFLAGSQRRIPESAYLMIHKPWSFVEGEAQDMRKQADLLDSIGVTMAGIYSRVSGSISQAEAMTLMESETWMTGKEAKDANLATDVVQTSPAVASINPKWGYKRAPQALISPSTKPGTNNQNRMNDAIKSLFGITAGAREKFLASAITALGVTPEAIEAAEKENKSDFLTPLIVARVNEADTRAKSAETVLAATVAALGITAPKTADEAASLVKAALDSRIAAAAAEQLAKRGVPAAKINAPAAAVASSELSGLQAAIAIRKAQLAAGNN